MKKTAFVLLLISLFCQAQETDSLNILKKNDWHALRWFDKDTVVLLPRDKIKNDYADLDTLQIIRQKKQKFYGERISFSENGELKYSNNMSCPVGESIKKIYAMELKKNKLIVDFEFTKWPWEKNEAIRQKREFEIIKWGSERIILK
ncbi:hypothetical protein [Aquimarina sp. Aq78]|uniref:hypothetical protein n=1 Tax=Aquimarina sp. Aq78 TaxID=1191889 RepID=UPI000D10C29F|nr:hypothetical protein [Aquimarina sp. Aq78]